MSVSKNSFSSMGHWREASLILRTEKFNRQLKEYSESKGILSLNDRFTGKSKGEDFPSKWSDYIGRPESFQHIDTHAIYSYWAKYKIYCIYKKLEPQYAGDEDTLYSALAAEASSEPWLSGKNGILYHKSVWKSTIDLAPTGVPKKIKGLRTVDAPEWK